MEEICEQSDDITKEEIYKLSAYLFEAAKLMIKVDREISKQLLELSSCTLDKINDDRFTKQDLEEIDELAREIGSEG